VAAALARANTPVVVVAREETAEDAGAEGDAPHVRVRASIEDAASAAPPSARLDAS